jgi:fido (protein-threonine AMPylation protein)
MPKEFERPEDQSMLEDREAAGLWKAIALSKEIGESSRVVDSSVILELHGKMFSEAMPEIAGRFRKSGEDVKKLTCIEPPLGSVIHEKMHSFEKDLLFKLQHTKSRPDPKSKKRYKLWVESIFDLAAWTQHKLVEIHPFCEGNGRVARLMTNIVLRRFHMPQTDVKIESEDKKKYINALCQIDKHQDYEPLRTLLLRGSIATLAKEKEKRQKKQATL